MRTRPLLLSTIVAVLAFLPAAADVKVSMKTTTEAHTIMGQERPASESTTEMWIGDGAARLDAGDHSTILDLAESRLVFVDHATSTYSVVDLPVDLNAVLSAEDLAYLRKTKPMWAMTADVIPTDETREIGGWPSRRYDVKVVNATGIELDVEVWTSDAIELDLSLAHRLKTSMAQLQPTGSGWLEKILAIDGVPVLQRTTMRMTDDEIRTREELVSIERDVTPDGGYAPPASYERVALDPRNAKPLVR